MPYTELKFMVKHLIALFWMKHFSRYSSKHTYFSVESDTLCVNSMTKIHPHLSTQTLCAIQHLLNAPIKEIE
jgi:hypothetical protein